MAKVLRYTHYGRRELALIVVITLLAITVFLFLFSGLGMLFRVLVSVILVFVGWGVSLFFRDPLREVPFGDDLLLSPADGRIVTIEDVVPGTVEWFGNEDLVRIIVFLSIFNVHITRAPCDLKVQNIVYRRGSHRSARSPKSSLVNENSTLYGSTGNGKGRIPLAVKQISGAVARRIVSSAQPGQDLVRGQSYGMIKFGSRTEVLIPRRFLAEIRVKPGDRVKAAESPLGVLKKEIDE